MTGPFISSFQSELSLFHQFLQNWIKKYQESIPHQAHQLIEALKYAVVGGKRFRPLLAILTAKAFRQDVEHILPYACAVEFLHTYSLIHDDLPAMDNADKRRGRSSLHKAFNEATAILAGDALLTEAFILAVSYKSQNLEDTSTLVDILGQAVGGRGMISGQILDIRLVNSQIAGNKSIDLEELYSLKTGALISASIVGIAMLSGIKDSDILKLKDFAYKLGIAFQVADDLEDFEQQSDHKSVINCAHQWGVQVAQKKLWKLYNQSLDILKSIENTEGLQKLIRLHFSKSLKLLDNP